MKAYAPGHVVSNDEVLSMLGVLMRDQNVSKAIITTTSSFAPGVYADKSLKALMPYRLELKDGQQLTDWLKAISKGSS